MIKDLMLLLRFLLKENSNPPVNKRASLFGGSEAKTDPYILRKKDQKARNK